MSQKNQEHEKLLEDYHRVREILESTDRQKTELEVRLNKLQAGYNKYQRENQQMETWAQKARPELEEHKVKLAQTSQGLLEAQSHIK